MAEKRAWCGLCGTYVYEDDVLPCQDDRGIHPTCGVIGAPIEVAPDRIVDLKDDEVAEVPPYISDDEFNSTFPKALREALAAQEAQAAHEYARDREVYQNFAAPSKGALDVQIGGSHYNKLAIQPFEYSLKNGLGPAEHTAIKYLTRWKDKGGIKDLDKAIHTIQILKDWAADNGFS